MRQQHRSKYLITVTTLLVFLFSYTAVNKLITIDHFQMTLHQSPLLKDWSKVLSWLLPASELGLVLLLLLPRVRYIGLIGATALLSLFTFYIVYMMMFAETLPCSCGGFLNTLTWPQHLYFNVVFILLSATGIFLSMDHKDFIAINRGNRKPV